MCELCSRFLDRVFKIREEQTFSSFLHPSSYLSTYLPLFYLLVQKNFEISVLEINSVIRQPTRSENSIKPSWVFWFYYRPLRSLATNYHRLGVHSLLLRGTHKFVYRQHATKSLTEKTIRIFTSQDLSQKYLSLSQSPYGWWQAFYNHLES